VSAGCGLCYCWTDVLYVSSYYYSLQLWVEVLNQPVHSDIIAVVFLQYLPSHFIQLVDICIVHLQEVSA
jgi:hypothetical protein